MRFYSISTTPFPVYFSGAYKQVLILPEPFPFTFRLGQVTAQSLRKYCCPQQQIINTQCNEHEMWNFSKTIHL